MRQSDPSTHRATHKPQKITKQKRAPLLSVLVKKGKVADSDASLLNFDLNWPNGFRDHSHFTYIFFPLPEPTHSLGLTEGDYKRFGSLLELSNHFILNVDTKIIRNIRFRNYFSIKVP